jgi:hypothetical protein
MQRLLDWIAARQRTRKDTDAKTEAADAAVERAVRTVEAQKRTARDADQGWEVSALHDRMSGAYRHRIEGHS